MISGWEGFFNLVKQVRAASNEYFAETNNFAKQEKLDIYNNRCSELDEAIKQHEDNRDKAVQLELEKLLDGMVVGATKQ